MGFRIADYPKWGYLGRYLSISAVGSDSLDRSRSTYTGTEHRFPADCEPYDLKSFEIYGKMMMSSR